MKTEQSVHRSIAILQLPRPVGALITTAQSIVTAMTGNADFVTPTPPLASVATAIAALHTAESAALSRVLGAVVVRNDKRVLLVTLLEQLRSYVQTVADADQENGAAIIRGAGLALKKARVQGPRSFTARPGPVSGSVTLRIPSAGHRVFYEWSFSTDGGKTWVPAPSSLQTRTVIPALPVGSSVEFRYRTVAKTGVGDWSQTIAILVK